jgi:hypothetical protein
MGCTSSATALHPDTVVQREARRLRALQDVTPKFVALAAGEADKTAANLWGFSARLSAGAKFATILDANRDAYEEFTGRHWNIDAHAAPAVVIRVASDEDVLATIALAKAAGLQVSVVSGYHSARAMRDGTVVVDFVLRKGVTVSPDERLVVFESGARIHEIDTATSAHKLVTPLGTNPYTGAMGLILAGGFGFSQPRCGMAVDNVVWMDVALADGTIVRASETEHSDLLWQARGSGATPGVVLRMALRCHPIPDDAVTRLTFVELSLAGDRMAKRRAFVRKWESTMSRLSHDNTSALVLPVGTPALVSFYVLFKGLDAQLAAADQKLATDELSGCCCRFTITDNERFFSGTQRHLIPSQASGFMYQSFFGLRTLDDATLDALLHFAYEDTPKKTAETVLMLWPMRGVTRELDQGCQRTSFAHRDCDYGVLMLSRWSDVTHGRAGREDACAWYGRLQARLRSLGTGDEFAHAFSTPDPANAGAAAATAAGAASYGATDKAKPEAQRGGGTFFVSAPPHVVKRLVAICDQYDPTAVFVRNRHNSHVEDDAAVAAKLEDAKAS